jgi:hypothetical protein
LLGKVVAAFADRALRLAAVFADADFFDHDADFFNFGMIFLHFGGPVFIL